MVVSYDVWHWCAKLFYLFEIKFGNKNDNLWFFWTYYYAQNKNTQQWWPTITLHVHENISLKDKEVLH